MLHEYEPSEHACALARKRIVEPAQGVAQSIEYHGASAEPPELKAVVEEGKWWLISPWDQNPVGIRYGGRLPLPKAVKDRLDALADAEVVPDVLWIAHEMPKVWVPGDPVYEPVPPKIARSEERVQRILNPTFGRVQQFVARLFGRDGDPAIHSPVSRGLKNIILGGVRDPEQANRVIWYELARWAWE